MFVFFRNYIAQFKYLPRAAVLTLIIIFAPLFIQDNSGKEIRYKLEKVLRKPWLIVLLFYLSYILVCTLLSRTRYVPYRSILKGFKIYDNGRWSMDCVENIVLFVPLVFFYLKAHTSFHSLKNALFIALLTSVFVELSQLIFWLGAFQISDIIYNVLGGLVGWILWHTCNALTGKLPDAM